MRLTIFLLVFFALALSAATDDALTQRPDVKKALAYIQASHEKTLDKQVTIAEIAAPTFHEGERAKFMEAEFHRLGLANVEIDKQGNVLGWRPGEVQDTFVLAAHLDIAFAEGVNTKVRKDGARWFGPGLGDDSRGLAALIDIIESMNEAQIKTHQTMLFVANVGEEGLGDLNGMKYLFQQSAFKQRLREFISMDGTNPASITNSATGVKRYLVTLRAPGGHSFGNFGRPNAIHAAARVIDHISAIEVPKTPKTTFNVGRISGGTSVNAIAEECSFEVDLRSNDAGALDRIEAKLFESVRLGAAEENQARAESKVEVKAETKLIGNRPGGTTVESSPLVQAAMAADTALGLKSGLQFSSTDSNLPMSLSIPAITLGGGGRSGDAHSLSEWFEPADAWKGPQKVLLTILSFDAKNR